MNRKVKKDQFAIIMKKDNCMDMIKLRSFDNLEAAQEDLELTIQEYCEKGVDFKKEYNSVYADGTLYFISVLF